MRAKPRQPLPEPIPAQESLRAVRILLPLALIVLTFLLYTNAIRNPFIIDDTLAIERHPDVLNPEGIWTLWTHDYWARQAEDFNLYRPITVLSYHLNYRATGMSPAGFRVVNIALLAAVGCVAAMWMARYVGRACAWLAAAFLIVHPVNTELINHIVGRADLLAVFGILGALYTQKRAIDLGRWPVHLILSALFCTIIALGSKETGVLLVPLAILQAWLEHPINSEANGNPMHARARVAMWAGLGLLAIPTLIYIIARASAVGLAVHYHASSSDMISNPLRGLSFVQRLPGALSVAWFDFKQLFIPDTSFSHVPTAPFTWADREPMLGLLVLIGVLAAILITFRRRHWLCVALCLALGQYLIVGNLILPSGVYAANRLMLPIVVAGTACFANILFHVLHHSKRRRAAAVVTIGLAVLLISPRVLHANRQWHSAVERMAADLDKHPDNPVAMFQLATELAREDKPADAAEWLEKSVSLRPDSPQARTTLGSVYLRQNKLAAAAVQFQAVVALYPNDWQALIRLGEVHLLMHNNEAAEQQFLAAQKLAGDQPDILYNLAQLAVVQGRYTHALQYYEALMLHSPRHELGRQGYDELKLFLHSQP